jgi:FMN phosphatase YigB (HAD superfamily)
MPNRVASCNRGTTQMINAILFDLDDTLLTTNLDAFLPGYFQALSAKLSPVVPPKPFVAALLASTRLMSSPHDPALTNQQVFEADFFPRLGVAESTLRPIFDAFYRDDFPRLRSLTSPRPEARAVVQTAFQCYRHVVIATQPVFPLVAIQQRLDWAGVADLPYRLVTSYENMHSCKPMPEYYLEIASFLGCPPEECLMVGNDRSQDIEPALGVGMATYWITASGDETQLAEDRGALGQFGHLLAALQIKAKA